jgi:hypothetical protein
VTHKDEPYRQLGHGRAYSSREGINVILPHESNRDGNHFFGPARGKVHDAIKACVEQVIAEVRANHETLWPDNPNPRVTVIGWPTLYPRGEYHWTAWDE